LQLICPRLQLKQLACQQAASNRRSTYDNRRTGSISLALKFSPIELAVYNAVYTWYFHEIFFFNDCISNKLNTIQNQNNNTNHGGCSKNSVLKTGIATYICIYDV
jgi:hypothetical protein